MEAITREEKIMSGENLTPITRKEMFLAKAAGQDVETPEPITREEMFLTKISGGGSNFPVKDFFARTVTEITLTGATKIGQYSFYQYNTLKTVYLPDVTEISSGAFNGCANLSTVIMGEDLITIGGGGTSVITGSPNIKSITIPSSVKTIGWNAFTSCTGLETVTFLGKPESLGSAFDSAVLPTSVKTVNCPWAEGEVAGAPWGATYATIHYNHKGD